jgi:hypothetical protein
MDVKEELLGKRLRCPSCKEVFTARAVSNKRRSRERVEVQASEQRSTRSVETADRPSGKKKRRSRKRESERVKSAAPAEATLVLGAVGILLFGMLVGLAGGYFLFSRADLGGEGLFAELDGGGASRGEEDDAAAGASDDPDSPHQMVLGKWVGGISKDGMMYEFFKDGTVNLRVGKKSYGGKYKIVNPTTLWMEGPTGAANMDMKLTPEELELTAHSTKSETKVGDGPAETKADDSFSITLKFRRPGPADEMTASKLEDDAPKAGSVSKSGTAKGSPAKSQQPKASSSGTGRPKR